MSTPAPTLGQTLISLIEQDGLIAFGGPLLNFLTAVQTANGDQVKIAAAFIGLQGAVIAAAPGALGGLETQLAGILAAKLQALQAKIAAKPAA